MTGWIKNLDLLQTKLDAERKKREGSLLQRAGESFARTWLTPWGKLGQSIPGLAEKAEVPLEYLREQYSRTGAGAVSMPLVSAFDPEDPGAKRYTEMERQRYEKQTLAQKALEFTPWGPLRHAMQFRPGTEGRKAYEEWEAPPYLRGGIEAAVEAPLWMATGTAAGARAGLLARAAKGGKLAQPAKVAAGALRPVAAVERGIAKPMEMAARKLRPKFALPHKSYNLGIDDATPSASKRIAPILDDLVGKMPKARPKPAVVAPSVPESLPQRLTKPFKQFFTRTYRPKRILEHIDGGFHGKFTEAIYGTADRARTKLLRNTIGSLNGMRGRLSRYNLNFPKMLKTRTEFVSKRGTRVILNDDERIGVYLLSQNKKSTNHLRAMGIDDKVIKEITAGLGDDQIAYGKWLMQDINKRGVRVGKVKVNVEGGKWKPEPDYYPIQSLDKEGVELSVLVEKAGKKVYADAPLISKGFTKARKPAAFTQMRLGATDIYIRHTMQAENYVQMQPVYRDLRRILRDPRVRHTFAEAKMPLHKAEDLPRIMDDWLIDVVSSSPNAPKTFIDRIVRGFRVNAVNAVLGFNTVTAMKQFPSFSVGASEIGVRPAMKGMLKYLKSPKATGELIKEFSPQIYKRTIEREIQEMAAMRGVEKLVTGKLTKRQISMFLTVGMDKFAVNSLWQGGFDDFLRIHPGKYKEAAKYAESAVLRTQPIYDPKDLAALWRTGEIGKVFTMFQNQLNQNWNYLMFDIVGKAQLGSISKVEAVRRLFLSYIVPATMIGTIANSKLPTTAGEEGEYLRDMAIAEIPLAGTHILSALRGFEAGSSMATEPIVKGGEAISAIQGAIDKPEKAGKAALETLEAAGYFTGVPTAQPKRTTIALVDAAEGNLDDWLKLIWGEWIREEATKGEETKTPTKLPEYKYGRGVPGKGGGIKIPQYKYGR